MSVGAVEALCAVAGVLAAAGAGVWAIVARVTRWSDAVERNTAETRKLRRHVGRQARRLGAVEDRVKALEDQRRP